MEEPTAQFGPYHVLKQLGRGGMGVVYRAVHRDGGDAVALKTVRLPDARLLQGIRREIHALAELSHPGIVRIVDEGVEEGLPWYAMELVRGLPLDGCVGALHSQDETLCRGWEVPATEGGEEPPDAAASASLPWWTTVFVSPATDVLDELVEGPDSDGESAAAPPADGAAAAGADPVSLPTGALTGILTVARRLCSPLAFLHGEGIVHRDLKPDNVIVRPDGMPVLVDFGLLARFGGAVGREVLGASGTVGGTAAFMAPEQIRGELVDARTDLYALGCILYQMLSGTPPFVAQSVPGLLQAHLGHAPRRLSEVMAEVPEELDELVARLLAKDPRDRVGHADDVAAMLGRLGGEDGLAASGPRPRAYLYRPGLGGRDAQLSDLRERLEKLGQGEGGLVLLGGESGVGKTRLAVEFGREASMGGALLLTGECLETGARPLEPLRGPLQVVADRCRHRGEEETERVLGVRGRVLAAYEPALATLPGQERHPEPEELSGDAARFRLLASLAEALVAVAEDTRTLLILDDLQWADELTLDWLTFLAQGGYLEEAPVLVLGTYRTEEVSERLATLLSGPGLVSVELGRLDTAALGVMVGDMLALSTPIEELGRRLAQHSEGNPFFVAEYLRVAVSEGLLYRDAEGQWRVAVGGGDRSLETALDALPTPGSLRELVDRRLERLSHRALFAAAAAAAAGRELQESLLVELARLDAAEVMETARELLRAQVLEEGEAGALRFVHDKVREAALRSLPPDRKREIHGKIAEWYERTYAADLSAFHPALARHWLQAGDAPRGLTHLGQAGEQALRRGAYQEAYDHLTEALALDADLHAWGREAEDDPVRRARWERQSAEAAYGQGRLTDSRRRFERAAAILGRPAPGSVVRLVPSLLKEILVQVWHWLRPPKPLGHDSQEAGRLLEGTRAYRGLIPVYYFDCEMVPTLHAGLRSLNLAQRVGVSPELADAYANVGFAAALAPLPSLADVYCRRAIETARETEHSPALVWALEADGVTKVGIGDWARALESLVAAAELAEAVRDPRRWNETTCAQQTVLHHQGAYLRRLEMGRAVYEQGRLSGNLQGEAWGMLDQAESLLPLDRIDDATSLPEAVVDMLPRGIGRGEEIWTYGMLATAWLRAGREEQALEAADEALRRMAKTPPTTFYTLDGYTGAAEVHLARWEATAGSPPADSKGLARGARLACRHLRKFAGVMPIGRPAACRCQGLCDWLAGRRGRAEKHWRRALEGAERFGMPLEEGLANYELGRHLTADAPERRTRLERAVTVFDRLGAPDHLRGAEAALGD